MPRIYYLVFFALILTGCNPCANRPKKDFHILNLSFPRAGTASFARIFTNFNGIHEFMMPETIFAFLDFREGKMSRADLKNFLESRNRKAKYPVDSSTYLFIEPDVVIETFPEAKYFFALRPCDQWILSMIDRFNVLFRMQREGLYTKDLRYLDRFGKFFSPHLTTKVFQDVPTFKKYVPALVSDLAQFWSKHVVRTLEAMLKLKPGQRLVIHLKDLSHSIEIISAFSGAPMDLLNLQNTHMNKDTNADQTRLIVGERIVQEASMPEQKKVDTWLAAHPEIFHKTVSR